MTEQSYITNCIHDRHTLKTILENENNKILLNFKLYQTEKIKNEKKNKKKKTTIQILDVA